MAAVVQRCMWNSLRKSYVELPRLLHSGSASVSVMGEFTLSLVSSHCV